MSQSDGQAIIHSVIDEMEFADKKYGAFRSSHEGYGVLCEEVCKELLDAIHQNDRRQVMREAIQIAAVAIRIALSMTIPDVIERSGMEIHDAQ